MHIIKGTQRCDKHIFVAHCHASIIKLWQQIKCLEHQVVTIMCLKHCDYNCL